MSYGSVKRWYSEFSWGRVSLGDEVYEDCSATAVTDDNIDAVWHMAEKENRMTCNNTQASLDIGRSQIKKIVHDHLGIAKVCTQSIPHNLKTSQKRTHVKGCEEMLKNSSMVG